ncbi:hypothetical protein Pcinc_027704 [Petrolisthes cinctipes]|uniref:Uncharacterized protein n=1 Tax=Petrolisthes cinctipes TaxID=88211 RepID=A0AAE1F4D4_PETCI|nr:hypothetical protein Pcinc_027704 [Petrolisthes cinctipes]
MEFRPSGTHPCLAGVVVVTEGQEPLARLSQQGGGGRKLPGWRGKSLQPASRSSTDARFHYTRSSRMHISPSSKISTKKTDHRSHQISCRLCCTMVNAIVLTVVEEGQLP